MSFSLVRSVIYWALVSLLAPAAACAQNVSLSDTVIRSAMVRHNVPGVAVAVIEGERVQLTSAGLRRAGEVAPVDDDTLFEAASLSKPVFALLVLRLVGRGVIDLDLPVYQYLAPGGRFEGDFFSDDRYRRITPRMVLSHSAGLPNGGPTPGQIHFTPGEDFAYSGTGFRFLAAALESVTGRDLNDLLNEEVLEPLGMARSSFVWREDFADNHASGHDGDGDLDRDILQLPQAYPEGGLVTTSADYARFVRHVLTGLKEDDPLIRAMVEVQVQAVDHGIDGRFAWGLGWGIEQAELGERLWHTGSNGAFKSFVLLDPARQSALLLFTNGENGLELIPELLAASLGATGLSGRYQQTISQSLR